MDDTIKNAETIKRVVARCIASKTWRSECLKECIAYAFKADRKAVEMYVTEQYAAAGATPNGRW